MKKKKPDDTDSLYDNSLPVYVQDSDGKKKRVFDCVLINGEPYIESVCRDGHKVKTPVSAAEAAFRQLRLMEELTEWN